MKAPAVTTEQARAFQAAFDHFNARLFYGTLPAVLLTFNRKKGSCGYFAPERWTDAASRQDRIHEIALNPDAMLSRQPIDSMATLVHEMVHLWQAFAGKPSRAGYHNQEWASKMRNLGLVPSSTGQPGGSQVGQKMTHYFDRWPDGSNKETPFTKAYLSLPSECYLPALPRVPLDAAAKPKESRAKVCYQCPGCEAKAWGKPELRIVCQDCDEPMVAT